MCGVRESGLTFILKQPKDLLLILLYLPTVFLVINYVYMQTYIVVYTVQRVHYFHSMAIE